MPPVTRSSIHGGKPPDHDQPFLEHDAEDEDMESDQEMVSSEIEEEMMDDDNDSVGRTPLQSSAQELLRPLQETADRVGRQVEEFAQALDKFNSAKKLEGQKLWEGTWLLMDKYAEITQQSANRVKSQVSSRLSQKTRKSLGDTTTQKQNLALEADLWTLTAQLLPCKSPEMVQDTGFGQNTALAELHRYSTNADLWGAFLDVDTIASQYEMLLEWLQDWKRKTSGELKESDLDFYEEAQRGQGLWSGGNIYTQAPIKRQKVTRAHPGPLSPSPDIRNVHIRKSDQHILATNMDPDAPVRQDAFLEPEDEAFEKSAWQASWEMLRRGSSLEQSRKWWRDRNELWRSLVLRNSSPSSDLSVNQTWLRIINLANNQEYLSWCKELSGQNSAVTDYERAVYGIMCGSYAAAAPVCKTIDDHLFSLINELLIDRYEQFLSMYRKRLQDPSTIEYVPPQSTMGEIAKYFAAAQTDKATKNEAHQPHKYLQGMLMSDELSKLLLELGHAAAQMAHLTGQSRILFDNDETPVSECAQVAAQDEDIVRIAAHLQLAMQPLRILESVYLSNAVVMENNIINYIGLLERHGKYSLLPLYTSKLSPDRQPRVLGRILSKVTVPKERDTQMRLMKQYQIPVYRVIYTICDYARRTWAMQFGSDSNDKDGELSAATIIEYKNKIVRVRAGFMGEMTDEKEAHVIQAHEWINFIDAKNWGMAVWLMTALYKTLLLSGKLAAAKALSSRVGLADTSLKVTGINLSLATTMQDGETQDEGVDTTANDANGIDDPTDNTAVLAKTRTEPELKHPLTKETTSRTKLADQSVVWAHLEHLVDALDALELWQDHADNIETIPRGDKEAIDREKTILANALQNLAAMMQPLLEHDFLNRPTDEQEDHDLNLIRNHYLPECVLAYNSALYFAGHALTRQHLVQCMVLAQQVAKNDSLTKAFVASKRMQELVTAFALDSQALLRANEHGSSRARGRGAKRSSTGRDQSGRADIWQVTWKAD